ncbi:MAG TPA: hypothetical protein DEB10_08250 [Ruminococcaceae bacterium]|nr:hypothetical protein [Oscillospiraceae bacterium]
MTLCEITRTAYAKFKLLWMCDHGYDLDDFVKALAEQMELTREPLVETYWQWENDSGFGGAIWPCYAEFIDNEFLNQDFMAGILNDVEYSFYQKAIAVLVPEKIMIIRRDDCFEYVFCPYDNFIGVVHRYCFGENTARKAVESGDVSNYISNHCTVSEYKYSDDEFWPLMNELTAEKHSSIVIFSGLFDDVAEKLQAYIETWDRNNKTQGVDL